MTYYHVITDAKTGQTTQVPFTAEEEAAFEAAGRPKEQDYANAIQTYIDETAMSRQYADGFALASYVNSTVAQWAAEATAFVAWRDQVWLYAYAELAKVQSGQRPQPTIETLIDELPDISWP